jgi:hypothetical protein
MNTPATEKRYTQKTDIVLTLVFLQNAQRLVEFHLAFHLGVNLSGLATCRTHFYH